MAGLACRCRQVHQVGSAMREGWVYTGERSSVRLGCSLGPCSVTGGIPGDLGTLGGLTQFVTQLADPAAIGARKLLILNSRRDGRVAEGARLESVCRGNSTVGSNPTLSANFALGDVG